MIIYRPNRRSIRLPGYDYSRAGAYFVTICTKDRKCLFGDIAGREMALNDAGRMVKNVWDELPKFYPQVSTDAFQIMPNHIHGIIVITRSVDGSPVGAGPCVCPNDEHQRGNGQPRGVAPTDMVTPGGNDRTLSLPDIVHRFKTMTTNAYIRDVKQNDWPPFPGKLWQRNYYEHVVRDENEMVRIREYIANNPAQWATDRENPMAEIHTVPDDGGGIKKTGYVP